MLSYHLVEFGQPLKRVAHETPRPVGRQVLVRMAASGVCHSDLHLADGYYDLGSGRKLTLADRGIKLPMVLGHEVVGEAVALGPEASGVRVGDRRLVFPWLGCGGCVACRADMENLCASSRALGVFQPGGYADHVLVPDSKYLLEIGDLDPGLAATYACSGVTAYSALKKVGSLFAGDSVAIVGLGGVGLAAVAIAPALLPAAPNAIDVDDRKLDAARGLGIERTLNANEPDAAKRLRELAGQRLSAVVDFVGSPATARLAIDALTKGGRYIVVGLFGGDLSLPLVTLPLKALTVQGSYTGSIGELRELLTLASEGKIRALPVARQPLDAVNRVMDDLRAGRIVGRTVLTP
jgi:D-arabinose 1-dehydrogenase-like Zn-dependent alcohol dehydrogenase